MKEQSVVIPLIVVGILGAMLGFCVGADYGRTATVDLQRKAVASHAAYWKPDPGTGKPVLVWAREEDR